MFLHCTNGDTVRLRSTPRCCSKMGRGKECVPNIPETPSLLMHDRKRCYAGPGSPECCHVAIMYHIMYHACACGMQCHRAAPRCPPSHAHVVVFLQTSHDTLILRHRFIPLVTRHASSSSSAHLPGSPSLGPGCRSPGPVARARPSLPLSRPTSLSTRFAQQRPN